MDSTVLIVVYLDELGAKKRTSEVTRRLVSTVKQLNDVLAIYAGSGMYLDFRSHPSGQSYGSEDSARAIIVDALKTRILESLRSKDPLSINALSRLTALTPFEIGVHLLTLSSEKKVHLSGGMWYFSGR